PFSPSAAFVSGLVDFCRQRRVYEAELGTYGSPPLSVPRLPRGIDRRTRPGFVLDLAVPASQWRIGETHRRPLKPAQKSSVSIRRARTEGLADHLSMCQSSLLRRRERGEVVTAGDDAEFRSVVQSGIGELFQVVRGSAVLSSILVIRSRTGAYYYSAGTGQE